MNLECWYWLIAAVTAAIFYVLERKSLSSGDWLIHLGAVAYSFFMGVLWPATAPGLIICLKLRGKK